MAKGARLALLARNSWQYGVLASATAKIGVVLVPVNFMLGAEEIAYTLRHSGATAMVVPDRDVAAGHDPAPARAAAEGRAIYQLDGVAEVASASRTRRGSRR